MWLCQCMCVSQLCVCVHLCVIPMRGTESDVAGMISATSSMNTVRDSSTVMPDMERETHKTIQIEFLLLTLTHKPYQYSMPAVRGSACVCVCVPVHVCVCVSVHVSVFQSMCVYVSV